MKRLATVVAAVLLVALALILGVRSPIGPALMTCVVLFWLAVLGVLSDSR